MVANKGTAQERGSTQRGSCSLARSLTQVQGEQQANTHIHTPLFGKHQGTTEALHVHKHTKAALHLYHASKVYVYLGGQVHAPRWAGSIIADCKLQHL